MINAVVANTIEELEVQGSQWDVLVHNCLEPNLYFTPQFLIPAFRYFQEDNRFSVVFLCDLIGGEQKLLAIMIESSDVSRQGVWNDRT
jgi:hypothetical protein